MPGSWGLKGECSIAVSKWTDQLGWKRCSRCIFMQHDTSFLGGTAHDKAAGGLQLSNVWPIAQQSLQHASLLKLTTLILTHPAAA